MQNRILQLESNVLAAREFLRRGIIRNKPLEDTKNMLKGRIKHVTGERAAQLNPLPEGGWGCEACGFYNFQQKGRGKTAVCIECRADHPR